MSPIPTLTRSGRNILPVPSSALAQCTMILAATLLRGSETRGKVARGILPDDRFRAVTPRSSSRKNGRRRERARSDTLAPTTP